MSIAGKTWAVISNLTRTKKDRQSRQSQYQYQPTTVWLLLFPNLVSDISRYLRLSILARLVIQEWFVCPLQVHIY